MSSNVESEFRNDLVETINKTQALLYENKEDWISRYKKYAEDINKNLDFIESARKSFRQLKQLMVYLNTTSARNAISTVLFELRYYGQTVAELTGFESGELKLSTKRKKRYEKNNLRDFDCEIQLNDVDWVSDEAREFRKFFIHRKGPRKVEIGKKENEEARLESLWLSELEEKKDKALSYATPVRIGKVRFSMPTPISASQKNKPVKYSGFRGGGIDILARVGTGGPDTYLCIMELKAKSEPPKHALRQAVAYTTFIRELLRSELGRTWWPLFGFSGEIPKKLILYAAYLIPNSEYNDYSFKDIELPIKGEDIVKLHYVYFTETDNKITSVNTSLKWL